MRSILICIAFAGALIIADLTQVANGNATLSSWELVILLSMWTRRRYSVDQASFDGDLK
jgi:hypothetical protein